eukprot:6425442-Prymnesium_polylepis.1
MPWKKPLRSRKSRESGMQTAACASVWSRMTMVSSAGPCHLRKPLAYAGITCSMTRLYFISPHPVRSFQPWHTIQMSR